MGARPLDPAVMERILEVLSQTARANPELPALAVSNGPSVHGLAMKALAAETGESSRTWQSRFFRTKESRGSDFEAALRGSYAPGVRSESRALVRIRNRTLRYLLTAAQDDTPVHEPFWRNLLAYGEAVGAEVMVGGFTYGKALFSDHAARSGVFAEAVRPYLRHENVECGPLLFAAKMNTLPTAVRPLSGLDTYTQGRWGVFPHAKIQLVSVPALPGQHPAMLMTTGACTVANYVEKKAGLKAEFHHQIGATIVEVDPAGRVFCRQISATDDGSFQDLDARIRNGEVTRGHRVEQITWGDVHREKLDPVVARTCWGLDVATDEIVSTDTMLDALRPRHQGFHDLLDFAARNHHRRGDHHFLFEQIAKGTDSVEAALRSCSSFLRLTAREWCTSFVVPSNHNDAYPRWLREADPRQDPLNALFWLRSNVAVYEAIQKSDKDFDVFRWAVSGFAPDGLEDVVFVPRNGSYVVCQAQGGIECGIHGHEGPNGARGTPTNLTRVATRLNTGHTHVASILDGVYTAGLCGLMDQGYNTGPSGWSHTQVVTYSNGKRTLVTLRDGLWRAAA
jgi:hypothetical protein